MHNTTNPSNACYPHNRYNPLKDEWVLVSPQRIQRPWQGQIEKSEVSRKKLSNNPLLPGAKRVSGKINDHYTGVYLFENDFPALIPCNNKNIDILIANKTLTNSAKFNFFRKIPVFGECKVMCYSPDPEQNLTTLLLTELYDIIQKWKDITLELGSKYPWVQIFENKGELMGASNPHPHCQIWASSYIPNEIRIKDKNLLKYYMRPNEQPSNLLFDYVNAELEKNERIIDFNADWVTLVPFWAVWPFETMVLPYKRCNILRLTDLTPAEMTSLAEILKKLLTRYDNLFQCPFPYSMGWHGAPFKPNPTQTLSNNAECNSLIDQSNSSFGNQNDAIEDNYQHWLVHAIFLPPLLRSSSIKKYMVGYELLAQYQRDLTPECAAEMLKKVDPNVHYTTLLN